jgi:Flp pilus assembly secretin CpaC
MASSSALYLFPQSGGKVKSVQRFRILLAFAGALTLPAATTTVARRTGVATALSGETVPIITVRADTVARVRQGETIVIAGLVQSCDTAGSARPRKTDLVILLTPTLMAR